MPCHHSDEDGGMGKHLLHLAKCAKHELLKEKMKKQLDAQIGKKLDKIAEAAVNAFVAYMQQKEAEKHACEQFEENLTTASKG
jgi:hypothetical protein